MTLILGMSDPVQSCAILCVDSGVWSGDGVCTGVAPKMWRTGPFIVAMAGALAQLRVAKCVAVEGDDPEQHVDRIIDAIASRQEAWGKLTKDGPDSFGIVIACGMRVLDCGHDGGLCEPAHGVVAVGAGERFVHGAAVALRAAGHGPEAALRVAMQHARELTTGCHWPVRWMATDGTEGVWE